MKRVARMEGMATSLLMLLIQSSPYLPALLFEGVWNATLLVAMGALLLIVLAFKEELGTVLALCMRALALRWRVAPFVAAWRRQIMTRVQLPASSASSLLFQRPPPRFV